ncbi:MAG: hypothetical protein DRP35_09075 [Candidatus Zixiibacteriota bacterium]|nr:MAG: hypothetical protein DRP35_09075 [candidate division Zixibacteria bacterium]
METTLANISKDGTISNPSVKHENIFLSGMVHEHFVSEQDETSTLESKRARLEATMLEVFTFAPNINAGKTNEINSLKEDLLDIGGSLSYSWWQTSKERVQNKCQS